MIDPKLWSQIQVTGITESDYERAVRHIDTINAMNNLTYNGIFIYDNFKMDHFYLTPNTFGRLGYKRSDVNNIGRIFIDAFITPEGQKAIWKAYAYYQQYVWSHSEDEKRNIVLYCNYDNLAKDNRQLPCVKYTPLEFAPDGRVWLSLGITTTEPHQKNDIFGIQNITRGEIVTYDMQTDQWTTQKVPTLSTRERVILLLMGQGRAVQSVAERLGMSENTVATHRKNIFKKLGAHTVAEAMAFAVKYKAI